MLCVGMLLVILYNSIGFTCKLKLSIEMNVYGSRLDADKVRVVAEFVAGRVNNAHFSIGRPQRGAKWVWLADYIEQIAKLVHKFVILCYLFINIHLF